MREGLGVDATSSTPVVAVVRDDAVDVLAPGDPDHRGPGAAVAAPPLTIAHRAGLDDLERERLRHEVAEGGYGSTDVVLVESPVAVAAAHARREAVGPGATLVVVEVGARRCDVAVVRRGAGGFERVGPATALPDAAGDALDDAVARLLADRLGLDPVDPDHAPAIAGLRAAATRAKETLSWSTRATVPVAAGDDAPDLELTRTDLEALLAPVVARIVDAVRTTTVAAEVPVDDVAALVLAGGSARIPSVSESLVRAFGRPIAVGARPERDVAVGAALLAAAREPAPAAVAAPPAAAAAPPPAVPPRPTPPAAPAAPAAPAPSLASRRRRRGVWAGLAAAAAVVVTVVALLVGGVSTGRSTDVAAAPTGSTGPSASASPSAARSPGTAGRPVATMPVPADALLFAYLAGPSTEFRTISTDGTRAATLATVPGAAAPVLSHDRRTIAYRVVDAGAAPDSLGTLRVMAADGTGDRPLFDAGTSTCAAADAPLFSPDDTRLAVACSTGDDVALAVTDPHGTRSSTLVARGVRGIGDWSPDGRRIVFATTGTGTNTRLATVTVEDPPTVRALTTGATASDAYPTWSRDGRTVLFSRTDSTGTHVWELRVADGVERQLTSGPDPDLTPDFAPGDPGRIIFARGAAVWIANTDGTDPRVLTS